MLDGPELLFDLESNGLLHPTVDTPAVSKVHCISVRDVHTGQLWSFRPWEIQAALDLLYTAKTIIGHNIVDYDLRVLKKLFGWAPRPGTRILDTLILAKMTNPGDLIKNGDMRLFKRGHLPGRLIKSHSLKAWGIRLGEHKDEYEGGWAEWNEEMQSYMDQDTKSNLKLFRFLAACLGWGEYVYDEFAVEPYRWPDLPVDIEHELQGYLQEMSDWGWGFNTAAAAELAGTLANLQEQLTVELQGHLGEWWDYKAADAATGKFPKNDRNVKMTMWPDVTIPRYSDKTGKRLKDYVGPPLCSYYADAPYVDIKRVTFNPTSRDHIAQRLQAVYGWQPKLYGDNGKPTVDETTLREIPDKVLPENVRKSILDYLKVSKVLGQLSQGSKAWLRLATTEGTIHHTVDALAAITARAAHRNPNLGQVVAVQKDDDGNVLHDLEGGFGWECRTLFGPYMPGWVQSGTDASALELGITGHYMAPYDDGEFLARATDHTVDIHEANGEITGLPRQATKTCTYTYLFGGGAWKIGIQLKITDEEGEQYLHDPILGRILNGQKFIARKNGETYTEPDEATKIRLVAGQITKNKFEAGLPALKSLKDDVVAIGQTRGWVKGLDGRKLFVRKAFSSLSTLVQGGGAIACKVWVVLMCRKFIELGLWGTDIRLMAWVHDETQWQHKPELADLVEATSIECMAQACDILGVRAHLRTETKHGHNWAECH